MSTVRLIPLIEEPGPQGLFSAATGSSFSQQAIDRAIARASTKLTNAQFGFVLHADSDGELSMTAVQRIGDHLTAQEGVLLDTSDGFKFDRQHFAFRAELIGTWGGK